MNNGENPMRWDCDKQGCFNLKKRPKIEVFAECFPGRINFGDVDGLVEINGSFLFLEWKPGVITLSIGQRILYERLTRRLPSVVAIVAGDPEHMNVERVAYFAGGTLGEWKEADLATLKNQFRRWAKSAAIKKVG